MSWDVQYQQKAIVSHGPQAAPKVSHPCASRIPYFIKSCCTSGYLSTDNLATPNEAADDDLLPHVLPSVLHQRTLSIQEKKEAGVSNTCERKKRWSMF